MRAWLATLMILVFVSLTADAAAAELALTDLRQCPQATGAAGCESLLDPQGRLVWIRGAVDLPPGAAPEGVVLEVWGLGSWEAFVNGRWVGANGRPGADARQEAPGRYHGRALAPASVWRRGRNEVALRMSAFHVPVRLSRPVALVRLTTFDAAPDSLPALDLLPLLAAGVLVAAFTCFAAVHLLDRTRSSLLLALLSAAAFGQAAAEALRRFYPYAYPFHPVRLVAILAFAWLFAVLLAAFLAERFAERRRLLWPAIAAVAGMPFALAPLGFDSRTAGVMFVGALAGAAPTLSGVRRRKAGSGMILAFLAVFVAALVANPSAFLDQSFYILVVALALALALEEFVRLRRVDRHRETTLVKATASPDRLSVATAGGVERVALADILLIKGADDYAELHLRGGRVLLHAARLDQLEAGLGPAFLRVHRSTIVHMAHARRLDRAGGRWTVEMDHGDSVLVSRNRLAAVRERFADQV